MRPELSLGVLVLLHPDYLLACTLRSSDKFVEFDKFAYTADGAALSAKAL